MHTDTDCRSLGSINAPPQWQLINNNDVNDGIILTYGNGSPCSTDVSNLNTVTTPFLTHSLAYAIRYNAVS